MIVNQGHLVSVKNEGLRLANVQGEILFYTPLQGKRLMKKGEKKDLVFLLNSCVLHQSHLSHKTILY